MKPPSDSDPFMDLQFDLIDEDQVPDDSNVAAVPPPRRAKEPANNPTPTASAIPISVEIDDAEIFSRDTAIPALPPEEFAAASMRSVDIPSTDQAFGSIDTLPPPGFSIPPPASNELEFADFGHPADVFGHALPGPLPATPLPQPLRSDMPTAPPGARFAGNESGAYLEDTTRNPVFVENALQQMAEIPDSGQEGSPLRFVDSHSKFVNSLSPVAGLNSPDISGPPEKNDSSREMHEAYELGDYTHALQIAESILEGSSADREASQIAQESRSVLTQMLAAKVGPLDQVMAVVVSPEEMQWLSLDHRSGFLLSLVDGQSTVDEILDISGMTRHDALKIILELMRQQVVQLA